MRGWGVVLVLAGCNKDGGGVTLGGGSPPDVDAEHWSGTVTLDGAQQVGAGQSVVADAGTTVEVSAGASLIVVGSFTANGTADEPVVFDAPDGWIGINVQGSLTGTYLQLLGRGGGLGAQDGSTVDLTDSELDLKNPGRAPDCTSVNGGDLSFDHVRIHGCHCPLHVNSAASLVVTNSILDEGATQMLANVDATFTGNDIESPIDDIGGSIAADIAGNYWGGSAPQLSTGDPGQFTGADDWSPTPIPGAGPR